MKKLISLILALMLLLPAFAMAETATTVDFGAFTMQLGPNDQYEVASQLANNQVYAIIYPDYDPNATFTDSINLVWTSADLAGEIKSVGGIETYAQYVLQSTKSQYAASGIAMSNPSVLAAQADSATAATLTTYTLDYSGAGVELVLTLYQMQAMYFNAADNNFIFTLTSTSLENLQAMSAYLDTVVFTGAAPAASAETTTVDFGAFTMDVGANDYYEVASAMTSNTVYLMLYPDYYLTGQTTNNLNVVYTEDNLTLQLLLVGGMEKYAELTLQQAATQYEAMGIKMSDPQIIYTAKEGNEGGFIISSTLDYSGAGIDLVLTLYQMTAMFIDTPSGNFLVTLTATSMDELSEMTRYLDSVEFK